MPFVSFSCPIALGKSFSNVLSRGGESRHPAVSALREMLLSGMFNVGFSHTGFYHAGEVSFYFWFIGYFSYERELSFVKYFSSSIEMDTWFSPLFRLLYYIDRLLYVEPSLHSRNKLHLVVVCKPFNLLNSVCGCCAEDFAPVFRRVTGL